MFKLFVFQEKDLKQYMDDCGNIMSMTNVKVRNTKSKLTIVGIINDCVVL